MSQQWHPTNPPTPPVQQRGWFARNKTLSILLGILLVIVVCCGGVTAAVSGSSGSDSGSASSAETSDPSSAEKEDEGDKKDEKQEEPTQDEPAEEPAKDEATEEKPEEEPPAEEPSEEPAEEEKPEEEPAEEEGEEFSPEQQNAISAAENYLDVMPFSKQGLIEQLSSDAGDGYPEDVAETAVEHIDADVDWDEQAVKAAESYQDLMPMSRSEMIQQLTSDAGDGYTQEQAEHAVDELGL